MSEVLGMPSDAVGVIASISAVVVSVVALFIALWSAKIQREHNRLSVRPLAEIQLRDMDGSIRVVLCNNGAGPLIIRSFRVKKPGNKSLSTVVEFMPDAPDGWTFFVGKIDGRSLRPDGEIRLLELDYESSDLTQNMFSADVRKSLQHLTVEISYLDIYEIKMPVYRKSLEWFGRNL